MMFIGLLFFGGGIFLSLFAFLLETSPRDLWGEPLWLAFLIWAMVTLHALVGAHPHSYSSPWA
jgi:hypothetical protein